VNFCVDDFQPVLPHHSQDGAKLNDDVERQRAFATETYQVRNDDLMTCARYRQKLGNAFNYSKKQCLKGNPKIHLFSDNGASHRA